MAKLNITRLDGESEADFKRRYGREQVRAWRAANPKPKKIRGADAAPRKNSPFTHEEWTLLQRRAGENAQDHKARTARARHAKRREADPKYRVEQNLAWREKNAEREREAAKAWAAANSDKVKATQRRHYHRHKEKRLDNYRRWVAANPDRKRQRQRDWYAANPGMNAFYSASWRKACREQTPPWADMDAILAIYQEAARRSAVTGVPHDVDHIIPVRGRGVRGLHIAANLRIVPSSENRRKHNTLDIELVEALMWADCQKENDRVTDHRRAA